MSAEILCAEACPWGASRMCVHTCRRAPLTHTHCAAQAEPLARIQSKHLHSEAPLYLCWASGSTVNIWEATPGQFLLTFTEKWLVKQ